MTLRYAFWKKYGYPPVPPKVCTLTNALDSGQMEAFLWRLCKLARKYRTDLNTVLCARITYKMKAADIHINTEQTRYSIMFQ